MWIQNKFKTIRWKWIQAIEQPEIVHIITREMLSKANVYAQITVRMHSQQVSFKSILFSI
jgi:large subunit ribosomal protein L45